mgnify:CR=1 FL=1|tara:strand:- start:67 stop:306 length:240 start_codon:yes stop_codon:yes gene_type:complete
MVHKKTKSVLNFITQRQKVYKILLQKSQKSTKSYYICAELKQEIVTQSRIRGIKNMETIKEISKILTKKERKSWIKKQK